MRKYLVTSALPYANGPLHLGHLAGAYLPADIFVRFKRLCGEDVVYICGSDEHGVPITIRAEKEGVSPRAVVDKYHAEMVESFKKMRIDFDNFSGTARPRHYEISQRFFLDLYENNHLVTKTEEQFFDGRKKRFLPDRYIEGKCPHCGYEKARGDQCDNCGRLLNSMDLINPLSILSGEKPVIKKTMHWYLKLQDFEERLIDWIKSKENWKDNVRNFVLGWIDKEGLRERSITRDIDWGIPVPIKSVEAEGKVLYVWFDAPIGYISSTVEWAEKIGQPEKWKEYWLSPDSKIIHFIGKDNIPFHAIIWPAILMGQKTEYQLPYEIPANEYLTLEGEKLSTSQNWAVWVDEYLEVFPPDPLRYFLAANAPETKDSDFSWKGFQTRNNEELSNILGNFANRTLSFLKNNCRGLIPAGDYKKEDLAVFKSLERLIGEIVSNFEKFHVREAVKTIMDIARLGNKYFDDSKPWVQKKENPERMDTSINVCMNILRVLAVSMYPVIPDSAARLWKMIGEESDIVNQRWDNLKLTRIKTGLKINEPEILFVKYDDKIIQAQIDRLMKKSNREEGRDRSVSIDEFKKFDLRVAEILEAVPLEKSKKLLKLKVRVGRNEKQILAGIKPYYEAEKLVGRKIVIINNLEPATLMGEKSEGMLLAASDEGHTKVIFLTPESDIESGSKVS